MAPFPYNAVDPFTISIWSIADTSIVRMSRSVERRGVDCGIPSIRISALLPRSDCERELVVLLDSAMPGVSSPSRCDISGATLLISAICFWSMIVTVAAAFDFTSGMRVVLMVTSFSCRVASRVLSVCA